MHEAATTSTEPSPFRPGNPAHPSLRYVFLRFLRYGLLAWGGPVAQIGLMHDELVRRDAWITEARFRKTLALYQALPGPEANELAVYFGMMKRGRWGGVLAGLGFMLPGVTFVTALAALYVAFGAVSPVVASLLYAVRPAVVALVAIAFVRLARASVRGPVLTLVAAGAIGLSLAFPAVSFLLVVAAGGVLALAAALSRVDRTLLDAGGGGAAHAIAPVLVLAAFPALTLVGFGALAVLSLKVGLLTFGGAYTAIPFLHEGAVVQHAWITDAQFLDALALAGMVPGPLIAIATFVGYLAAGLPGALLATVLVFTPAFAFTLLAHDWFERIIHEPRLHAFLLGITAAVIGLIAVAFIPLAQEALVDVSTVMIALAAGALVWSRKLPIPAVIALAAAFGLVRAMLPFP